MKYLSVVLILFSALVVDAYPNGAGACRRGVASVSGEHKTESPVTTGDLSEGQRGFYFDELLVDPDNAPLLASNSTTFISVKTTSQQNLFRGVLIRVQAVGDVTFTFVPKSGDTLVKVATACIAPAYGITYNDSGDKRESGGVLSVAGKGELLIDVTVVDFLEAGFGSKYWFSSYTITVGTSPSDSPTDSPTDLPSGSPRALPSGSPSAFPSNIPTDSPSDRPVDSPSNSPTDSPTDSPKGLPTNVTITLFEDDFEGGLGNFRIPSVRAFENTQSNFVRSGLISAGFKKRGRGASIQSVKSVAIKRYTDVTISFWFLWKGKNLGAFTVLVREAGGSKYSTLMKITQNGEFEQPRVWHYFSAAVPGNSSKMLFRIRYDGGRKLSDNLFVDDLTITGLSA